ncbi:ABC transporter substrate-binding protein [Agaribacterium sp. ZY112]|uniref:ABC transporter substrate-binding protein n=1 Tax=Agaribacterium sp. ZY112 TaxID=3233574 RepID=UPI00352406AF
MTRSILRLLISLFVLSPVLTCYALETVSVGLQFSRGDQRLQVQRQIKRFEQSNPDIKIDLWAYSETNYTGNIELWLSQQSGPQLLMWYGGQRLKHYIEHQSLQNIDNFWQTEQLEHAFAKPVSATANYKGHNYAIPLSYSLYSLYYTEAPFKQLGISIPSTWQEVLRACKLFDEEDLSLFSFGGQTQWSVHGWFDYLNLRINGLEFYEQLLSGVLSYEDPKVKRVFDHWAALLNTNCFNANHLQLTNKKAFPRLLHKLSGMMLLNNIPEVGAPNIEIKRVKYNPFPTINDKHAPYTLSPVNVLVVPSYTKLSPAVLKVMSLFASAEFQYAMNGPVGRPPARNDHSLELNEKAQKLAQAIRQSPGGVQYFDRDTDIRFASQTPQIMLEFMQHRDSTRACKELEQLRQQLLHIDRTLSEE